MGHGFEPWASVNRQMVKHLSMRSYSHLKGIRYGNIIMGGTDYLKAKLTCNRKKLLEAHVDQTLWINEHLVKQIIMT